LSFLLNYKAARVRVVVDCGYNNWTITGIANTMQLSSVSVAQSVNLMSGDPSGDSAGNKTVAWSISGEGTEQTSNPLIVMPTATSTTLTVTLPIDVIVRKSPLYPIPTESVYNGKFTTTLQAGHSYKLFVKLKAPKFAGSNIYFDKNSVPNGPQLIFDEHGDNTHQGYQGLFFRFGSLRGISPAGAFVANSTAVYYILAPSTAASYDAIQYWDLATHGSTPIPEGNCHVEPHVGDICACIRYGYRLPKPTEFGIGGSTAFNTSTPVAGGWVKGSGSFGSYNAAGNGYEDGTANLLTTANGASAAFGSAYNRTMNITLPASGYRTPYGLVDVGLNGQYWGGTQSSDIYAPRMGFNSSEIYTQGGTGRDYAHTVRCVKAD
jgi:hypothetical protein